MILTKEQAIENHRKMWNWIADETLKQKRIIRKKEYFSANNISSSCIPFYECYCCEYSTKNCRRDCSKCPIKWENGDCIAGEFSDWTEACIVNNYTKAAKLARIIAYLPENKQSLMEE